MASVFLKNARIVSNPARPTVSDPCDIAIENGVVQAVGVGLKPEKDAQVLEFDNLWVSAGWVDIGTQTCDPGYEHREDLLTGALAAAAGGFTTVATLPNTHPAVHSKAEVLYIQNKTAGLPVRFLPMGAVSQGCEGKDLAELFDMHQAGAIAFSDGVKPLQDAGLLLRALQYVQAFNGLVINQPFHKTIASGGQMHEGVQSTMLGMKGIPALAEEISLQRDLSLLEYSGGRLHLHLLSTAKSVDMVRRAKAGGLAVSCDATPINLLLTDAELATFDSNFKVNPPLRSDADRKALLEGLADGVIDCLCSHHQPWDIEAKNLEFPYAEFGMIGLETAFALSRTATHPGLAVEKLVAAWAFGPRKVLGLPIPEIRPGAPVDLTLFNPDADWTVSAADIRSRSSNTPFVGRSLRGRVYGILRGEHLHLNRI